MGYKFIVENVYDFYPKILSLKKRKSQGLTQVNSALGHINVTLVAPMETDQDQTISRNHVNFSPPNVTGAANTTPTNSISPPKSRSKLPVLNRRLSLNAKDYMTTTPCSSKSSVAAR